MSEIDARLLGSWKFYRSRPMTDEEQRAACMLEPVSAPLGLTEWRTTEGVVYGKGANAVSAQVGINKRAAPEGPPMTLLHQAAQKAVEAKQREAFEHWYSDAGRWPKSVARGEDGHYLLAQTNSSYEAWRAAAAALQHQEEPREPVAEAEKPFVWLPETYLTVGSGPDGWRFVFMHTDAIPPVNSIPLYRRAASPSTTRQQEAGSTNGELSKPMPTLLAQRIVGALECGALWAEGSEAHPRILKTLADFNTWIVRQDAVSALSDEEIAMIARGMPMPPWGIGSRREDAIAFARKVLAAAPSTPENADGGPHG